MGCGPDRITHLTQISSLLLSIQFLLSNFLSPTVSSFFLFLTYSGSHPISNLSLVISLFEFLVFSFQLFQILTLLRIKPFSFQFFPDHDPFENQNPFHSNFVVPTVCLSFGLWSLQTQHLLYSLEIQIYPLSVFFRQTKIGNCETKIGNMVLNLLFVWGHWLLGWRETYGKTVCSDEAVCVWFAFFFCQTSKYWNLSYFISCEHPNTW